LNPELAECGFVRTIWSVSVLISGIALALVQPARVEAGGKDDFVSIFDGRSLNGWRGKSRFWTVRDNAITGETTKEKSLGSNTFLIFKDSVADFELRIKVKILSGNSGVQFRSVDVGDFVVRGYQTDIDSTETYLGDLYEEGGRGALAKGGEKVEISESGDKRVVGQTALPGEIAKAVRWRDWNDYRIVVRGSRILQEINGVKAADVIDRETNKARADGILALQLHAGQPMLVQFKDIRLKRLK
jgi:hypothetical protein